MQFSGEKIIISLDRGWLGLQQLLKSLNDAQSLTKIGGEQEHVDSSIPTHSCRIIQDAR